MSAFLFDLGEGHLSAKIRNAAEKAGGIATNYTEPNGQKHHWFEVPNFGAPFNERRANAVREAVRKAASK